MQKFFFAYAEITFLQENNKTVCTYTSKKSIATICNITELSNHYK